eukprot:jgi/Mesen1/10925/ME000095S10262
MPYCTVESFSGQLLDKRHPMPKTKQVRIFYETYGKGDTKILLIMGYAAGHQAWGPQLVALAGTRKPNGSDDKGKCREHDIESSGGLTSEGYHNQEREASPDDSEHMIGMGSSCDPIASAPHTPTDEASSTTGRVCCAYDNRGVGKSTIPIHKSDYSTLIMAHDALSLIDHLGWDSCHIVGHSMGGMIACKLASMAPQRVASLAIISSTCGGYEVLPRLDRRSLSLVYRFMRAKTVEERAAVDLDLHYSREYLEAYTEGRRRRHVLHEEYVANLRTAGKQPPHGTDGHLAACWTHCITPHDAATLSSGGFLISVIHGRHDIVARMTYGHNLARKLHPAARMTDLPGAHMLTMENPTEVNAALLELLGANASGVSKEDWMMGSTLPVVGASVCSLLKSRIKRFREGVDMASRVLSDHFSAGEKGPRQL